MVRTMNVVVYTTSTCPFCKMLMTYLTEKSIAFTEKKVDEDKTYEQEMMNDSGGFLGVPFTVIEKEGVRENVIGFDKNRLNVILGIQ